MKNLLFVFLLGSCLAGNRFSLGQDPSKLFQAKEFSKSPTEKLLFRLLSPDKIENQKKYPLVLFLHGAGERGNDNQAQLVHGMRDFCSDENRKKYPCFVVAPQCPKEKKWVNAPWNAKSHSLPDQPSDPLRLALLLVEELAKTQPVDTERIYITGLSMGGFGTFDAICRRPDLFAAALPICGGGDEKQAKKIRSMPLWIVHGDADKVVLPQRSQKMFDAIKKAGGDPKLTMMKGVGHNSWSATYANPKSFEWLFSQKKKTTKPR